MLNDERSHDRMHLPFQKVELPQAPRVADISRLMDSQLSPFAIGGDTEDCPMSSIEGITICSNPHTRSAGPHEKLECWRNCVEATKFTARRCSCSHSDDFNFSDLQ
jgi:hypothetical protein